MGEQGLLCGLAGVEGVAFPGVERNGTAIVARVCARKEDLLGRRARFLGRT